MTSSPRRAGHSRRRLLLTVMACLLVAAAVATWFLTRGTGQPSAAETSLATATVGAQRQTVTTSGTIQPAQQASLSFGASGRVTSVTVATGDKVSAGQTLATIDPTALQAQVTAATAGVAAAQANLTATRAATTSTTAQLTAAEAQLQSARAKLTAAQQAAAQATLTSPFDGVVASVGITVGTATGSGSAGGIGGSGGGTGQGGGAAAGSSGSTGSGSTGSGAIVVISTASWIVNASVSGADLPRLAKGLQAEITPTGTRQLVFGTVSTIGVMGTTSGGVATFPVVVQVTGSPSGLYAGGTADVIIVVKQRDNVLTIPTAAVRQENGATVVTRSVDGVQSTVPVTVGQVYGTQSEITAGLAEGDQVVVPGRATGRTGGSGGGTGGPTTGRGGFGGITGRPTGVGN